MVLTCLPFNVFIIEHVIPPAVTNYYTRVRSESISRDDVVSQALNW